MIIAAKEAIQCPNSMINGFKNHRIKGIGDAFASWILNLKNIDIIIEIDDKDVMEILCIYLIRPLEPKS